MEVAARAARPAFSRTLLKPSWPIDVAFAGYPIWWLLGVGAFIWPVLAGAMLLHLVVFKRQQLAIPRPFILWMLMSVWIAGSALQLDDGTQLVLFAYRLSLFLSAGIFFLYVYNSSSQRLSSRRVAGSVAVFWGFLVLSGLMGVFLQDVSIHSPIEAVMPAGLIGNEWVHDLVHIRFSQVHDFLGYEISRPSAPFPYSNEWGSTMALALPLLFLALGEGRGRKWRLPASALIAASVVPLVISVNRGTWLALGVGLLYVCLRLLRRGRPLAFFAMIGVLGVLAVTLAASPLGDVIGDRLDNPHSNEGRAQLYEEALALSAESPLLGHGAPQQSATAAIDAPAVGTHGLIWMLLITSGVPALVFFLAWILLTLKRATAVSSPAGMWAGMVIVMVLVMVPYYGLLPTQLHIVMVAAALLWRPTQALPAGPQRLSSTPR